MATAKQITEAARTIKAQIHSPNKNIPTLCAMTLDRWTVTGWISGTLVEFYLPDPIDGLTDEPVPTDPDGLLKAMKEYKPGETVDIQVRDGQLVTAGVTLPAPNTGDGWPEMPAHVVAGPTMYDPARILAVAQFASTDDLRPILTGVRFDETGAVATDSYRLAVDERVKMTGEGVTLPGSVVAAVCKMSSGGDLAISHDAETERYSVCTTTKAGSSVTISGRAIAGEFPDFQNLFPESFGTTAPLMVEQAQKQAAKVNRWADRNRPVTLTAIDNRYALGYTPSHMLVGGAQVEPVAITGASGGEAPGEPIGFNGEFFAAVLDYIAGDSAPTLNAISPLRPIMLQGDERRALLMPIRLNV